MGKGTVFLDMPQGATVADAVSKMRDLYPQLAPPEVDIVAAVNTDYVEDGHPLNEGDQVALIPPVSGGMP